MKVGAARIPPTHFSPVRVDQKPGSVAWKCMGESRRPEELGWAAEQMAQGMGWGWGR